MRPQQQQQGKSAQGRPAPTHAHANKFRPSQTKEMQGTRKHSDFHIDQSNKLAASEALSTWRKGSIKQPLQEEKKTHHQAQNSVYNVAQNLKAT